jgi:septum formation inhibitor-activating ATPase MinD
MSIVLALASNKGGVGKTTTAVTIGSYFAFRRNWRVLIVEWISRGTWFISRTERRDGYL